MDKERLKLISGAVVGAFVIGAGAYFYGTSSATPEIVAVSNLGCGTSGGAGNFGVPLRTVSTAAPTMSVSYGVIELPGVNKVVRLNFDREIDGRDNEVTLIGDTLHLPLTFGRNDAMPARIRINCRDGAIAGVRYERDRANATFNIVHREVSEVTDEALPASDSTEG